MSNEKFAVIGFPKCGTVSAQTWLLQKYPNHENILKLEFPCYGDVKRFEKGGDLEDYTPVFITRDPAEMLWSFYVYFNFKEKGIDNPVDMLDIPMQAFGMHHLSPLKQADFDHWIGMFKHLNPLILSLEEIKQDETFPHENKTERLKPKPQCPESFRKIVEQRLASNKSNG